MKDKTTRQLEKESKRLIEFDPFKVMNENLDNIDNFKPHKVCFLVSSGDDSLSSYLLSREYFKDYEKEVLHIDTKTGMWFNQFDKTDMRRHATEFIKELCKHTKDKLIIKSSKNKQDQYLYKIKKYGLPNSQVHQMFYTSLKERCIKEYLAENKPKKILFIVGIRENESRKRKAQVQNKGSWQVKTKREVWFSPVSHWFKSDCIKYLEKVYKRSEVSINIGSSGECTCGATAHNDEKYLIGKFYPRNYNDICYWEELVTKIYGVKDIDKTIWGNTCKDFKQKLKEKFSSQTDLSNLCGNGNCKLVNKEII